MFIVITLLLTPGYGVLLSVLPVPFQTAVLLYVYIYFSSFILQICLLLLSFWKGSRLG